MMSRRRGAVAGEDRRRRAAARRAAAADPAAALLVKAPLALASPVVRGWSDAGSSSGCCSTASWSRRDPETARNRSLGELGHAPA